MVRTDARDLRKWNFAQHGPPKSPWREWPDKNGEDAFSLSHKAASETPILQMSYYDDVIGLVAS